METFCNLWVDDGRNACSAEMELLFVMLQKEAFDEAAAAVNKKLFTVRVECGGLLWNRAKALEAEGFGD